MLKSEIEIALDAQTQDWTSNLGMNRDGLEDIPVQKHFATIITGVRRCGKSTLLRQWAARTKRPFVAVLFDDFRLLDFTPKDFIQLGKIIAERKATTVFLDEIQGIEGWERFVCSLLAQDRQVFVTGSNAKMLSAELGTKLTGRHLDYHLTPFSYREYLRFTKSRNTPAALDAYLHCGGFPAYVESGRRQILEELFTDILYRDIVVRYRLTNTQPIKQLAFYLLNHIGTRLSPSRLTDAIHVQSAKTVLDYFDHLTECGLIDRLEQWAESPKARMLAQKKVYACDTGLVSSFERGGSANLGHKLENVVFQHLKQHGGDLSYYREGEDCECDFLHEAADGTRSAVQVCYHLDDNNQAREINGLLAALTRFDLPKGTLVTAQQKDSANFNGREIEIIPATNFLH